MEGSSCICGCAEFRRSAWLTFFSAPTDATLCSRCAHPRREHALRASSAQTCSRKCSQYAMVGHTSHVAPLMRRTADGRWRDGLGSLGILPNDVLSVVVARIDVRSACRLTCVSTAFHLLVSSHDALWCRWCTSMPWQKKSAAPPQLGSRCCWRGVFVALSKGEPKLHMQLVQHTVARKMHAAVVNTELAAGIGADPFGLDIIDSAVGAALRARVVRVRGVIMRNTSHRFRHTASGVRACAFG